MAIMLPVRELASVVKETPIVQDDFPFKEAIDRTGWGRFDINPPEYIESLRHATDDDLLEIASELLKETKARKKE
jgi:hypothetical protein